MTGTSVRYRPVPRPMLAAGSLPAAACARAPAALAAKLRSALRGPARKDARGGMCESSRDLDGTCTAAAQHTTQQRGAEARSMQAGIC